MNDQIEFIKNQVLELPVNKQGHRIFPASMKAAIRELTGAGISTEEISERTGIHLSTLHSWYYAKKRKRNFKEIQIRADETNSTVDVQFASGVRISGLNLSGLIQILKQELLR